VIFPIITLRIMAWLLSMLLCRTKAPVPPYLLFSTQSKLFCRSQSSLSTPKTWSMVESTIKTTLSCFRHCGTRKRRSDVSIGHVFSALVRWTLIMTTPQCSYSMNNLRHDFKTIPLDTADLTQRDALIAAHRGLDVGVTGLPRAHESPQNVSLRNRIGERSLCSS